MFAWLTSLDWNTIITSFGISGLTIWAGFQFILGKGADLHFSKQLEKYKRDLQDISEATKFEYQRKLSDFNLYTTKKHEHYIKLYEQILNAYGYVSHLASALKMRPSYSWYNEEDIRDHLKKLLLPKGRIDELVTAWNDNKNQAEREIYKCITLKEEFDAENAINEMKNLYWKSQLYMSETLSSEIKTLIDQLFELYFNCKCEYKEFEEPKERLSNYEKNKQSKEIIDKHFQDIVILMKEELTVGYYSKKEDAENPKTDNKDLV